MSSLIKGPLDGAAVVRGPAVAFADPPIFDPIAVDAHNASVREHRRCRVARCPLCEHASDKGPLAADLAPLPTTADVEHDGDRGPLVTADPTALRVAAALRRLSHNEREIGLWILEALPTLEARCRSIKDEGIEPIYQPDGSLTPNTWPAVKPEHIALGGLLGAVRDIRRVIAPYHGREVDPRARRAGGGE